MKNKKRFIKFSKYDKDNLLSWKGDYPIYTFYLNKDFEEYNIRKICNLSEIVDYIDNKNWEEIEKELKQYAESKGWEYLYKGMY